MNSIQGIEKTVTKELRNRYWKLSEKEKTIILNEVIDLPVQPLLCLRGIKKIWNL